MKRSIAALACVWLPAAASNDAADYAQVAALAAVQAESLCTTPINRRGMCTPRGGPNKAAAIAMSRASIAIDNFYLKCEIVFRGDMSTCDVMMGAFLAKARK